jgi:diguanylate cyclase (GGDEF)-like protein
MGIDKKRIKKPNLGKLSIAILEHFLEPIIGEKAIDVAYAPAYQKYITDSISSALEQAEFFLATYYPDKVFSQCLLDLPLATLPSIKDAVWDFYSNPNDYKLYEVITKKFRQDYPNIPIENIDDGVDVYIRILQRELANIDGDVREKLIAQSVFEIQNNTKNLANSLSMIETRLKQEDLSKIENENTNNPKLRRTNKLNNINLEIEVPKKRIDISNRYFFESHLKTYITKLLKKKEKHISILMIDIDDLTIINKIYGKEVGDIVLKVIAKIIQDNSHECDWGRCGDDTFYFVLPSTELINAFYVAERIQTSVENYNWSIIASNLHATSSIGVAEFMLNGKEEVEDWIIRASLGMREAKQNGGKNCIKMGPLFLSAEQSRNFRNYFS